MRHLKETICSIFYQFPLLVTMIGLPTAIYGIELDDYDSQHTLSYLSPTRLKQSPHDIPASVSRITHKTISKLQLNSIPEVFRYIAGMSFIQNNTDTVDYHYKAENIEINSTLILIDGISIQHSVFNQQSLWSLLPLSVNDIDYIEVTRSPGAATYGISALMAVINIVTKDPLNSPAFSASATKGGNNYQRVDLSFSGKPSTAFAYRVSASTSRDDRFDNGYDLFGDEAEGLYEDTEINLFSSMADIKINSSTQASLAFYHSDHASEDYKTDTTANSQLNIDEDNIKTRSSYLIGDIDHTISPHHDISFKAYYTRVKQTDALATCPFTVFLSQPLSQLSSLNRDYALALLNSTNPNAVPLSGSAEEDSLREAFIAEVNQYGNILYRTRTCGNGNLDSLTKNTAVELQDTYIFNENLRVVSGAGVTQQQIDSMTLFQGKVSSTTYRLFTNAETRWNSWVFNSGVMLEYNDDAYEKTALSPRLGANYRLNEDSTLRFVLSKAVQIPDLSDRELNFAIYLEDFTMPYPADGRTEGYQAFPSLSADNMESQELLAREVSLYTQKRYRFDNRLIDIYSDIKLFYNTLYYRPYYNYDTIGSTSNSTLKGIEMDAHIAFRELLSETLNKLEFHVNYTYLDSEPGEFLEDSVLPAEAQTLINDERFIAQTGSLYSILDFKGGWFTTLAYSGNTTDTSSFDTYEFGIGKKITVADGDVTLSGKFSHHNRPGYPFPSDDSPNTFFLNASFSY